MMALLLCVIAAIVMFGVYRAIPRVAEWVKRWAWTCLRCKHHPIDDDGTCPVCTLRRAATEAGL